MGVDDWAQLAAALGGGAVLPSAAKLAWRHLRGDAERAVAREAGELARAVARIGDLEDLVDLLRKALDKHLIRESAVVGAAELMIAFIRMVPRPTPAMLHVLGRAQELLELASAQLRQINQEGQ